MRILHINTYYELKGGAEKYIRTLQKYQIQEGHKVFIVGLGVEESKTENTKEGIKIGKQLSVRNFLFDFREMVSLKTYINKIKPDIIHLHNIKYFSCLTLYRLTRMDIPIVQTVHDPGIFCPSQWALNNKQLCIQAGFIKCLYNCIYKHKNVSLIDYIVFWMRKYIIKNKLKFITPIKLLANIMYKNGYGNIEVIYHGIEYNQCPIEDYPDNHEILYLGRVADEKGVDILINAFAIVVKKYPDAKLSIVGDGPAEEKLKKIVREKNLNERVIFTGKVTDVDKYYHSHSVVVIPSIWLENSPLVLFEAMSYKCPVIASDIGGLSELINDGETGFKFPPGNYHLLAEKIGKVFDDIDLVKQVRENEIKTLNDKHNMKQHIKNINQIYTKIISENTEKKEQIGLKRYK